MGFDSYNAWLRQNPESRLDRSQQVQAEIGDLLDLFDATPAFKRPIRVHRYLKGVSQNSEEMMREAAEWMADVVSWFMKGFVSATTASDKFDQLYAPTGMTYVIDAIHGLYLNRSSTFNVEAELLLRHESRFRVLEVTDNHPSGGGVLIRLEQLPPEKPT